MIVAVVGSIALPSLIDTGGGTKDIGLSGATPEALPAAIQAQADAIATDIRIHRYATRADGEQAVRDGKTDVLVVDGRQLEWQRRADEQLKAVVTSAIQTRRRPGPRHERGDQRETRWRSCSLQFRSPMSSSVR